MVGDIGDREFLARAIPEGVDAVFHVAGNVSFDSAGDAAQTHANVAGTRAVVEAAKAKNAGRFIHTSTGAVFGLHDGVPIDETAPSNADEIPVNYCRSKKAAEDIVLEAAAAGLDAVCVNPGNVVGPYDRVLWGPFVQAIASGAMTTVGTGGGAFCHIDETAKAHITAYERGRRGERYILAGANESFATAARIVAGLVGVAPPVPTSARNPTRATRSTSSPTRLRSCCATRRCGSSASSRCRLAPCSPISAPGCGRRGSCRPPRRTPEGRSCLRNDAAGRETGEDADDEDDEGEPRHVRDPCSRQLLQRGAVFVAHRRLLLQRLCGAGRSRRTMPQPAPRCQPYRYSAAWCRAGAGSSDCNV